jgi:hypothetical protein
MDRPGDLVALRGRSLDWRYVRIVFGDIEPRWYPTLVARDKASLDIFWLKDESLEDSDNLPGPGIIAAEIVEDLESALEQMRLVAEDLGESSASDDGG